MPSPTGIDDLDGPGVLQFSEPISWKLGRPPIAVTLLMKRLKQLLAELCELEQETVDRRSLSTAARDLCAPALLQHKDKGVKAVVACALAEMLRLHAPDAPYTAGQLRDIFDLFVKQLRYLSSPDSAYNTYYIQLLKSLSVIKSIVLMADIPNGDALILQLFTYFFDIGAKPGVAEQVEYYMNDILVQLVAECNSLPSEVVDIIVAQFLRANPTATNTTITGGRKEKIVGEGVVGGGGGKQTSIREHMAPPPPAYNMARVICTSLSCVDKMARHICQYFAEVIFDASPSSRPSHHHHHRRSSLSPDPHSSPDPAGPPTDDDLKELSKAHLLVKELWRAAPGVLQNVIPQLEQELLAENVQLRLLATETIGEMSATSPSPALDPAKIGGTEVVGTWGGSFASTCPASWRLWLGRVNDKSWLVRSKWVECATRVLQTLSPNTAAGQNAAQALVPLIADKLNDTDERVRLATCRSIGEDLDYASVKLKLNKSNGGEKLLENLALRAKDKKHSVRVEGMRVLARMWDEGYEDIRRGEEAVVKLLGWIPGRLLETSYVNDKDVNVLLDRVMWEVLLPLEYPPGCLESGKKKHVAANVKGKSGAKAKGTGKEKESAKKSTTSTTRILREKKPQTKQKDTLDFSDSDDDLSDPPESKGDEAESDEESESEQATETDENQQPLASQNSAILTHDHNRTIRLLHLAHNLSPRSLRALLALASRQLSYSAVLNPFLDAAKNFGTMGHALSTTTTTTTGNSLPPPPQADNKARLTKLIDWLANQFPDPARSREHLWKWVRLGDRRGWSLVRGMLSVDAGWTQVVANLKEVVKRIEKTPGGGGGMLETVLPLLYRSALLLWNKSHVPTIVAMSKEAAAGAGHKTPDQGLLGGDAVDNGLVITANLLLKEMSSHIPAVFKAHIASLCTIIQECAPPIPGSKKAASTALEKLVSIDPSIVDTLSALSTFAKKYPQEVPRERKLHQALFALATSPLSTPHAAKHAVRVLMSAAMDRKEMYASDLVQRCVTEWTFGGEGFIVRLGAMAEMVLVAPQAVMGEKAVISKIKQICVKECLTKVRELGGESFDPEWESESLLSDEGKAKILAVKTLVNMLRANLSSADLTNSIMETLLKKILIEKGEISPSPSTAPTPKSHRAQLRLVAANSILKLAAHSGRLDELVSSTLFNIVALTAQDTRVHVRLGFLGRLKKLLAAGKLGPRWYTIVFLVAHDPEVREETGVWIRARAKAIASASASANASASAGPGEKVVASANIMELVLARLISLLAHHPDFPRDPKASSNELLDMARYLAYYIRAVVTAENIGVVWYIAGYIKRVEDGIDAGKSERLYILSELTQALCRRWKEMNEGWAIETWPGKIALPSGLFKKFDGGKGTEKEKRERVEKKMKEISMRVYLPEEVDGKVLDGLLREKKGRGEKVPAHGDAGQAHGKKRKSDGGAGAAAAGATKKRRQTKGGVVGEGDGEDESGEGKKGTSRKSKTPRKKRASLVASEGVGATPKTPKRTSKKRRKSGGGDDDDDDARDADADDAGMSTVERRRSGRVVSKVVYAENEEEEGTGEELEKDDSGDESGDESGDGSGDGSGEDEDAEDGDADRMDIDDPELEPKTRTNPRGADANQTGKIIPKTTKRSKNTPLTRRSKKKKENGDRDGDEPMSDVSELTQFDSERGEAQDDGSEPEREIDVDGDETGKEETLEDALLKPTPKAITKTKTTPGRRRGRGGPDGSGPGSEVTMAEAEVQKSPVKQMVVGRVTRRGAAAGR
ncbi:hypothetical protein BGX38DRAFT_1154006 [Terfezia claveryi]|nr:hypothetical protein BGX38DRAFT_1154006 [Terfezia claveryi]